MLLVPARPDPCREFNERAPELPHQDQELSQEEAAGEIFLFRFLHHGRFWSEEIFENAQAEGDL